MSQGYSDSKPGGADLKERGNAFFKDGKFEEAVEAYTQALDASKGTENEAPISSNLSLALLKTGKVEAALSHAERCMSLRPEWSKAHHRVAEALFELERIADARSAYTRAKELEPSNRDLPLAIAACDEAIKGGPLFKQLLPGRDIALPGAATGQMKMVHDAAVKMQNFIYLVGDSRTRQCYVIDACWDTSGIVAFAKRHKIKIVGAIPTHYHFDHTGGKVPEMLRAMVSGPFGAAPTIPGLRNMKEEHGVPVYSHKSEVERIAAQCSLAEHEIEPLSQGQLIDVSAEWRLKVLHTPGHSGGSVCLMLESSDGLAHLLCTGDTIFPGSCGRLDLPDSDCKAMFDSLDLLRKLPDNLDVYPGHAYGGPKTTIAAEKRAGLLRPFTWEQWLQRFGSNDD
eukprot:TRINITY_DN96586_c0_g1_i1.p1 TRINITY_DN96586_c0_g1~~TRINITY_DN96586_c0_g1_i1.p1  ORF type:complete len:397 (-),score=69.83 TRINITY_DN96586_c0_g1_i1:37-1227(-)